MNLYLKILISVLLLVLLKFGLAQNLTFDFSDNIKVTSDYKPHVCFKNSNKYILVQKKIKSNSCDIKINLFDNQLNLEKTFIGLQDESDIKKSLKNLLIKNEVSDVKNPTLQS